MTKETLQETLKPPPSETQKVTAPNSTSGFKPVGGSLKLSPVGETTTGFRPIAGKPDKKSNAPMPAAYMSSATHFKPIILQHRITPLITDKKQVDSSTDDKKTEKEDQNKDKEVVRKLKELKHNLMKHRSKEGEILEGVENKSPNSKTANKLSKEEVVDSPKKAKISPANTETDSISSSMKDNKGESSGVLLESLLNQIQKQGDMPDTDTLAAAIAQHLQGHLSQGSNKSPRSDGSDNQGRNSQGAHRETPSQDITKSAVSNQRRNSQDVNMSGRGSLTPQNQPQTPHFQTVNNMSSMLPNMFAQQQQIQQQQLLGQPLTLPQQPLSVNPTLQVQLVQDPRTGFLQLMPVNLVATPISHCVTDDLNNTNSDDVNRCITPGDSNSAMLNTSFNSGTSKSRPGRTAKDLVQKTANIRAKNSASQSIHSETPPNPFPHQEEGNLWRSKSAHNVGAGATLQSSQNIQIQNGQERMCNDDSALVSRLGAGGHPQNSLSQPRQAIQRPLSSYHPQSNQQYFIQPQRTRSQSSSPSPSKDSGVSGMNTGYKPPPPGSLMERLLSNVNVEQQKKLGTVVHLLREEFAFDGYMENGVEDLAMGEFHFCYTLTLST